jgi:hypothetical protein
MCMCEAADGTSVRALCAQITTQHECLLVMHAYVAFVETLKECAS